MIITSEKELKRIVSEAVVEALALAAKPKGDSEAAAPIPEHRARAHSLLSKIGGPGFSMPSPINKPQPQNG